MKFISIIFIFFFSCVNGSGGGTDIQNATSAFSDKPSSQCSHRVPANAIRINSVSTKNDNRQTFVVLSGGNCTFSGTNNSIYVRDGGAINVVGTNNEIIVEKGGAAVLSGSNNTIYHGQGGAVTTPGANNQTVRCDQILFSAVGNSSKSTKGGGTSATQTGLETAAGVLANLAGAAQELGNVILDDVPADRSNVLIGSWDVQSATLNGSTYSATGTVNLYPNGKGIQNYAVDLQGKKFPQVGEFTWESDNQNVYVNGATSYQTEWERVESSQNRQVVALRANGQRVQLTLARK